MAMAFDCHGKIYEPAVSGITQAYLNHMRGRMAVLAILTGTVLVLGLYAVTNGSYEISAEKLIGVLTGKVKGPCSIVIREIRLPRVVASLVCGWGLAVSGLAIQSLLKNPLGSPSTPGISHGAAFGAALSIIGFGGKAVFTTMAAFTGAMTATFVILLLSALKKFSPETIRDSNPEKTLWSAGDVSDYESDFNTPAARLVFHHVFGRHSMSLGGEYARGKAGADWEYYGQGREHIDFSQNLGGFFFEDSWDIFSKVNVTAGIRYDGFKNRIKNPDPLFETTASDSQWSPCYTLSFKPDDDSLFYFTGRRIFKAPTMADQYRWYSNYNFISFAGRAVLRAYYGIN